MQPALAILIFTHYGENGIAFTTDSAVQNKAKMLAKAFKQAFGAGPDSFVFMGRIGEGRPKQAACRSTRRPLVELTVGPENREPLGHAGASATKE